MDSSFVDLAKTVTLQGIEAIRNTAPVVYQAAYERAYADAVIGITAGIIFASISVMFLCVGLYGIKEDDDEYKATGFVFCVLFALISIIVLGINLANYYSLDFTAMENIRQLIVGTNIRK